MLKLFITGLLTISLFAACEKGDTPSDIVFGGETQPQTAAPTLRDRLEMPALMGDANEVFVAHFLPPLQAGGDSVVNYALAYDRAKLHSRWVAFRFDANARAKAVARKDYSIKPQYPRDPKLPAAIAIADDASFEGRVNDHGHLCASADRLNSRLSNDQTFYMSNMSPQLKQFNQNYWTALEGHIQDLGRDASFADTLYVVKGGTILSEANILQRINVRLANGQTGQLAQPRYYFAALLKVKNGAYSAIGFLLEHKNYGVNGTKTLIAQHILTIAELEKRTGIDFFHNLPDATERAVEASAVASAWRF